MALATARQANALRREVSRLRACGVVPDYDAKREAAWSAAVPCPNCDSLVHPDNLERHNALYHPPAGRQVGVGDTVRCRSRVSEVTGLRTLGATTFAFVEIGAGMRWWVNVEELTLIEPAEVLYQAPFKVKPVLCLPAPKAKTYSGKKLTLCDCGKVFEIAHILEHRKGCGGAGDTAKLPSTTVPTEIETHRDHHPHIITEYTKPENLTSVIPDAIVSCCAEGVLAIVDAVLSGDLDTLKIAVEETAIDIRRALKYAPERAGVADAIAWDILERPPSLTADDGSVQLPLSMEAAI